MRIRLAALFTVIPDSVLLSGIPPGGDDSEITFYFDTLSVTSHRRSQAPLATVTEEPEAAVDIDLEATERFFKALEKMASVVDMSDAELARDETESNERVLTSLKESGGLGFSGVPHVTYESFVRSWTALNEEFKLDEFVVCPMALNFWFERPVWYIPSRDDIEEIRSCIAWGIVMLRIAPIETPELRGHTNVVTRVLGAIIPVVYSPEVELTLRQDKTAIPADFDEDLDAKLKRFQLFRTFVQSHPRIVAMGDAVFDERPSTVPNSSAEDRLIASITDTDSVEPAAVHLFPFADHLWESGIGDSRTNLVVWSLVHAGYGAFASEPAYAEPMDRMDFEYEIRLQSVMADPKRDLRIRFAHGSSDDPSSWLNSVGAMLSRMAVASASGVKRCIRFVGGGLDPLGPTTMKRLFDILTMTKVRKIPLFYRCIVEMVEDGTIEVPDDERREETVSTLLHMMRVATSASAFLIWISRHA